MKKSFLKKALVMAGAALLALPLALGHSNLVSAADGDTTPTDPVAQQSITLVKYAYTAGQTAPTDNTSRDIFTKLEDGTKRLNGVTFKVYNVSQQYWSDPKSYQNADGEPDVNGNNKFTLDGASVDMTTKGNGEATASFNVFTTVSINGNDVQKPSVYVFHEDTATAPGYDTTQDDFALSLPQGGLTDDGYKALYVYPKNSSNAKLNLKFTKIDSVTKKALAGATFYIKKGNLYAHIFDENGKAITNVNKYDGNPVEVAWTDVKYGEAGATVFTSDEHGFVGFAAVIENTQNGVLHGIAEKGNYTAEEKDAPAGYEAPTDAEKETAITEDNDSVEIPNTPKGLLPHTGGAGIILFVALGAALVVLGGVAYNKRRTSF